MKETVIYKQSGEVTNIKAMIALLNSLPDGRFLLTAKNINKRSLPQNSYYWKIVVPMVQEGLYNAGYSEVKSNEDAHEVLKHLFLKKKITNQVTDEVIEIAGSTADLQTLEFNNFLEEVWQWASQYLGINIPEPNQQSKLFAV